MSAGAEISQAAEEDSSEKSPFQTASRAEGGFLNKQINGAGNLSTYNTPSLAKDVQAASAIHEVETTSLKHLSREAGISQSLRAGAAGKSTLKKPLRVGISRAPEAGTSGTVTLKQALRGLTLAQASELASLKRHSRPPGSSQLSDAGAIKQLYRAVVIPEISEPSTSKNVSRVWGTCQELEGGSLKTSLRGSSHFEMSEACMLKLSSVFGTSLSSVASTSKAKGDNYQSGEARPVSSLEAVTNQKNEGTHERGNEDTGDASLPASVSLSSQSSINNTDFVIEAISSENCNSAKISTGNSSEGKSSVVKTIQGLKASDRTDYVEISKSSASRGSNSSGVSDESTCSSLSSSGNRPHMSNDSRWEAIRAVRKRDGCLGLNHFRLVKRLGCGDIGSVYLTELDRTKCYFAMKVMENGPLVSRKKMLRAQTEREILQMLDHPFLPTLYTHFETDKFSCLVMEYCPGGDLHILRQRQPGRNFSEQAARFYAAEVLLALEYLHMLGIVYRDLKPENVLVREDGHIMLSDFDLSLRCAVSPTLVKSSPVDFDPLKRIPAFCIQPPCIPPPCVDPVCVQQSCVQPSCLLPRFLSQRSKKVRKPKIEVCHQVTPLTELVAEPTSARSNSFVGTHEYLAPEIVKGEGHGSAVDWWTYGIFLYELLFGKTPFKGAGNTATLNNVVGQPLKFPETPVVSYAAKDLVRGLLVKEPQHRLAFKRGATEIKQHPFFEGLNWALIRCSTPPEVPKPLETMLPVQTLPTGSTRGKKIVGTDSNLTRNHLEFQVF